MAKNVKVTKKEFTKSGHLFATFNALKTLENINYWGLDSFQRTLFARRSISPGNREMKKF